MKQLFFGFLLYVYVNHIVEDWDVYTKWGKIYYYTPWLVRSVLVWLICPIFLIPFFIERTETYKKYVEYRNNFLKTY